MFRRKLKFEMKQNDYLEGCESTKMTLTDILIDIELTHIECEFNVNIVEIQRDVNILHELELIFE